MYLYIPGSTNIIFNIEVPLSFMLKIISIFIDIVKYLNLKSSVYMNYYMQVVFFIILALCIKILNKCSDHCWSGLIIDDGL